MKPINVLVTTGATTKTGTLAMTFHKSAGEANPYVWFGIRPTEDLLSQPRTSFRINVCGSNKHDTNNSTIKKIWLRENNLKEVINFISIRVHQKTN